MTYIEFFADDAVENVCSSFAQPPDRVVLLGDRLKLMRRHAERYRRVFENIGHDIEFICIGVDKNSVSDIIEKLTVLVEAYEDCVFDLTGGEDLYLMALGVVFERYAGKRHLSMHRFNIRNGSVYDCDMDGRVELGGIKPFMSVEECIRIYGGTVRSDETGRGDLRPGEELMADIDAMWELCRRDTRLWNAQLTTMAAVERLRHEDGDTLTDSAPTPFVKDTVEGVGRGYTFDRELLSGLERAGLLRFYVADEDMIAFGYKNALIKECLTIAGRILELKIYSSALAARDADGSATYDDVMTGVVIDWDGDSDEAQLKELELATINEVDVMMTHGLLPVFVSCKNGAVPTEELYKLDAVAKRFGGKYARRVLVISDLDRDTPYGTALRARAASLGIILIDNAASLSARELDAAVRDLWHKNEF